MTTEQNPTTTDQQPQVEEQSAAQNSSPAAAVGKIVKSEEEWRQQLSAAEFHVLREAGTERPFTGEYTDTTAAGVYRCRACGTELFRSDEKFESHCGWPSFFAPLAEDRVRYITDTSMGMRRVEVRCAACDSHLGHVFEGEGYSTPTDLRYCINSISLTMDPR
ncbi:peptide-methionine (R)-S-oxide reductase MsrB [Microlunatus soli]|uniref:peptide-methionine (R)-S-oxide reductase n=1 Tax=Microlunatus soli TaxID=630515 RepID=A0A1H2AQA2_9ACTN|nr:peptide-methionine (R)-S-oxide reductase MsrB [Microlunatus soli]SDT48093.1 peptide-methionine (R)-S-oxide reductase [Microlunatus soli]